MKISFYVPLLLCMCLSLSAMQNKPLVVMKSKYSEKQIEDMEQFISGDDDEAKRIVTRFRNAQHLYALGVTDLIEQQQEVLQKLRRGFAAGEGIEKRCMAFQTADKEVIEGMRSLRELLFIQQDKHEGWWKVCLREEAKQKSHRRTSSCTQDK